MIVNLLLDAISTFFIAMFGWLPVIDKLPTIAGFDLDTAISTNIGYMNNIFSVIWPLRDMFYGFMVLMSYYVIKMVLRLFLGSRTPTAH